MPSFKPILLSISLLPFAYWVWLIFTAKLGANPVEALSHATGDWSLRFLLLTLAMTPLHRLGWKTAIRYRRMLGLLTFFYACLHALVWLILDRQLEWQEIMVDLSQRPYVIVGFLAFSILAVLALTSTKASMKRLGRHWKSLHRMIYLAAILSITHYFWLIKADLRWPSMYLALFLVLMSLRWPSSKKSQK